MKNSALTLLHRELIDLHKSLSSAVRKAKTQSEAEAILREMEEVHFRVMMCGRLLFKESTSAIDQKLTSVKDATKETNGAIRKISKAREIVHQVGQVLVIVDKALDALKLL